LKSPFILLIVVEFVNVVAARLGEREMEVMPVTVAPVHGICQQVDQVCLNQIVAIACD
jgi:hypothetical protein